MHRLIRVSDREGEPVVAAPVVQLSSRADVVPDLAYRLYAVCERTNRAGPAVAYNTLVRHRGRDYTGLVVAERRKRSEQSHIMEDR